MLAISCIYVGNLDPCISKQELEDEFRTYRIIRSIWVARKLPDYAFINFDDRRDVIRDLDDIHN